MSARSKSATAGVTRPKVVFERTYRARIEELWELWTTKKGFESWWGPEGFRVEVHTLEARVGERAHGGHARSDARRRVYEDVDDGLHEPAHQAGQAVRGMKR
jgi:uncharacterized protein YndB with AHSA1/START domain